MHLAIEMTRGDDQHYNTMTQKEKDAERDKEKEEKEKARKKAEAARRAAALKAKKPVTKAAKQVGAVKEKKAAPKAAKKTTSQAKTPQRTGRSVGKQTKQTTARSTRTEQDVNVTKDTPKERERDKSIRRWWEQVDRDRSRDRIYENIPRPITEQARPAGGPTPMIQPQVGPVGDLRSQVAHTYGYTPEAYKDLRTVPIRAAPAAADWEQKVAGGYGNNNIYLNSTGGINQPVVVAHEQAHAQWERRGYETPSLKPGYTQAFNRWEGQTQRPTSGANVASQSNADLQQAARDTGLYNNPSGWPSEQYARTVQFSPNADRSNWPDEVRPYYSGYLQGMDRLSTGAPTPATQQSFPEQPEGPDKNGRWGMPLLSQYRKWR